MGSNESKIRAFPGSISPMGTELTQQIIPSLKFRVLVLGRANAGKTSILQRVCETTESPKIYRGGKRVTLDPSMERGEHTIDDELVFSKHRGYVFHDSRGIESGSTKELEILKKFIRRKCEGERLRDRLHAIWYCVPLDGHRPELDLKFYENICPDRNVPIIVVFTKYDQFLRNVRMDVLDYPDLYPDRSVSEVAKERFQEHYVDPLGGDVEYVRLEKMHMNGSHCGDLIEKTAAALDEDTVMLMLLAMQRNNAELSVKLAWRRVHCLATVDVEHIIRECLFAFPYLWASGQVLIDGSCLIMLHLSNL